MEPYYSEDGITIYHGDCRDILPQLEPVDLVLTDPPYGENALDGSRAAINYGINSSKNWDCIKIDGNLLKYIVSKGKYCIIWGFNYYCDILPPTKKWLLWDKPSMIGMHSMSFGELAWTNLKGNARKFTGERFHDEKHHPTQKNIKLISWCISLAPKETQTILDPFMGSGTTLVAAKNLGRKAIGIPIDILEISAG